MLIRFGHLDSQTSIRRVLLVTSLVSLAYSVCQGTLEIIAPDETFFVSDKQYHLFAHGGTVFWFATSLVFGVVYFSCFILPWTPCRQRILLPSEFQYINDHQLVKGYLWPLYKYMFISNFKSKVELD